MKRVLHTIFWLALMLWFAAVVAPAIAAISAFTVLPKEGASIPRYEAYFADDPAGMGRMIAGYVTDPVFVVTDFAQWILAPLVLLIAILEWTVFRTFRGPGNWIRLITLAAALGLVVYHNGIMSPRMAENLADYREAAAQDNREEAVRSLDEFNKDHHLAETLFGVRILLIFCAGAATAAATQLITTSRRAET